MFAQVLIKSWIFLRPFCISRGFKSEHRMKVLVYMVYTYLGGGNSTIFCHFHPENWGRFPIWLIFFRWVETTNQICILYIYISFPDTRPPPNLQTYGTLHSPGRAEVGGNSAYEGKQFRCPGCPTVEGNAEGLQRLLTLRQTNIAGWKISIFPGKYH